MSDFDFDELDKAVTSALGSQPLGSTGAAPAEDTSVSSATDGQAAPTSAARQVNISIPSRSPASSPALHSRTMGSHRISPVAPSESPVETPSPEADDTEMSIDDSFASLNDAVHSIVDGVDITADDGATVAAVTTESGAPESYQGSHLPSRRRSGRFMDVVHPSSDMKTKSMTELSARKPPILQPSSDTDDTAVDSQPTDTAEPDVIQLEDITLESDLPSNDTPPPIDLDKPINTELSSQISNLLSSDSSDDTSEAVESVADTTDQPDATEDSKEAVKDQSDHLDFEETLDPNEPIGTEPQTSPFLEGVTVEKRPLGDKDAETDTFDSEYSTDVKGFKEDLKHPDDAMAADVLPDELTGELVSIEATDTSDVSAKPVSLVEEPVEDSSSDTTKTEDARHDVSMGQTSSTSIVKQYKEKHRTDDDTSGDIFDTKNYHKAIKDTEKKKTSPVLLIAVSVVIALLVAAGVFFAWWSGALPL